MVTKHKTKPMINDDLQSFLEDTGCSRMQFEILRFMGKHPKAKFSLHVISKAMGADGSGLKNALNSLIEKDVLLAHLDNNGLTTYFLADNSRIDGYIRELAALDWSEALGLKKQL